MQFILLRELFLIPEVVRIKNLVAQCLVSGRSFQDMPWEERENRASICPLLILPHFQLLCVKELPEPGVVSVYSLSTSQPPTEKRNSCCLF